jgi:hypothetical protein
MSTNSVNGKARSAPVPGDTPAAAGGDGAEQTGKPEAGRYLTRPPDGGWAWLMREDVYELLPKIGPYAMAVYLVLRCHADSDGKGREPFGADPGYSRLAKVTGFCRDTIIESVKALQRVGLIKVEKRGKQKYVYKFPKLVGHIDQSATSTSLSGDQNWSVSTAETGRSHRPKRESLNESKKREKSPPTPQGGAGASVTFDGLPEKLNTPAFRTAWERWLAYRRERRIAAYKPIGLSQCWVELAKFSVGVAIESIDRSIGKNWKGLFPEAIRPAKPARPIAGDIVRETVLPEPKAPTPTPEEVEQRRQAAAEYAERERARAEREQAEIEEGKRKWQEFRSISKGRL